MENSTANNNNDNNNAAAANSSIVSMENFNNVAGWVGATVISAFFSSLERFSCVNVATADFEDDDEDEASDRPFAISDNLENDPVANLPV